MKNLGKKIILIICLLVLLAEVAFLAYPHLGVKIPALEALGTDAVTEAPTAAPTEAPTEAPAQAPTEAPTEPPTEAPTEPPQPEHFLLTFTGDCTLGSAPSKWSADSGFIQTIGENYDYPFENLRSYFESDDFTIINFEGVLTESGSAASKLFTFRGPLAYTQIMTGSSVEAVTLANNHTMDYGSEGYNNTLMALENAGLTYVEENKTSLHTTESGLTIGLYADSFDLSNSAIQQNIAALKEAGAEVIICAFHWGKEGSYRPSAAVKGFAHTAIDAGANIVWGHHPHVLQPIEEYNGGIIYYSLGNCSFGGSSFPKDFDSAIVQQEVIRELDGTIRLGGLTRIPICVSSTREYNDYKPTPEAEDSEYYSRILTKLDGTFTGPDLNVNYGTVTG